MATIKIFMANQTGITGLKVYLRSPVDFSLLNPGGDVLTESGTSGWFTADISETRTTMLSVTVVNLGGLIPFSGWLSKGSDIVADVNSVISSDILNRLLKIEAIIAGLVTGAGTGLETFTGSDMTVRVTADEDGNRSLIEIL